MLPLYAARTTGRYPAEQHRENNSSISTGNPAKIPNLFLQVIPRVRIWRDFTRDTIPLILSGAKATFTHYHSMHQQSYDQGEQDQELATAIITSYNFLPLFSPDRWIR